MTKIKPLPPLKELQKAFDYDPITGILINRTTGNIQNCLDSKGRYIVVSYKNESWQSHRICYYLGNEKDPNDLQVDHKDQNKQNNKLKNLRLLTNSQQQLNTKLRSTNRSGHAGVFFDKKGNKWRAYIANPEEKNKKIWLYRGDSKEDAIKERKKAEKKYYLDMYL
tara:strand:- start:192 stop:689 length:498 start_codon:yes stop_codon:yes gene_type:complete